LCAPVDGKVSPKGADMLQRGDDKGIIGFTTGAGVPFVLERFTSEGNNLLECGLCLTAASVSRGPAVFNVRFKQENQPRGPEALFQNMHLTANAKESQHH